MKQNDDHNHRQFRYFHIADEDEDIIYPKYVKCMNLTKLKQIIISLNYCFQYTDLMKQSFDEDNKYDSRMYVQVNPVYNQ